MWTPRGRQLIYQHQSPYQSIKLFLDGNHYWLSLNNVMQFHTRECYASHEYMCKNPLRMVQNPKKVLIIGGGDGFAARELLKDPRVEEILNVELDHHLIGLTKQHPVMRILTEDAFHHPKVKVIAGDGIGFLINSADKYDIIIDDCEYDYTGQPGGREHKKYSQYARCLTSKLNPGGVACLLEPLVKVEPMTNGSLGAKLMQLNKYFSSADNGKFLSPEKLDTYDPTLESKAALMSAFLKGKNFSNWRNICPFLKVAIYINNTIGLGPEAYIYMANHPI